MSHSTASQKSATELSDFTLALIKPDAVRAGFVEDIINELNENGTVTCVVNHLIKPSLNSFRFEHRVIIGA